MRYCVMLNYLVFTSGTMHIYKLPLSQIFKLQATHKVHSLTLETTDKIKENIEINVKGHSGDKQMLQYRTQKLSKWFDENGKKM